MNTSLASTTARNRVVSCGLGALEIVSLVLGVFMLTSCRPSRTVSAPPSVPNVTVAQPISRRIKEWDEFTGRLVSPEMVEVRARVSGYLVKVHFKEGGDVKVGDLLFSIDPRPYQAMVDHAKSELGRTKARAELNRDEAKRAEGLVATKAISTDTYEGRVKTAIESEQAVHSTEAMLAAAQLDLEFTEVRSPIAGRISNARVTSGNLITGGSIANATLLTTIVSLDPIYCYLDVDEASALRYRQLYREGKRTSALFEKIPAEMALSNESGFPHQGVLDFVDNQLNPTSGTIRARATFANSDRLMAPGFFARVRFPGTGEYSAMLIRDNAISSDQGRAYVLTVDDKNLVVYHPVKLGPLVDGLRVVREGLSESDRVIVAGLMNAKVGNSVQAQTTPMSTNSPALP